MTKLLTKLRTPPLILGFIFALGLTLFQSQAYSKHSEKLDFSDADFDDCYYKKSAKYQGWKSIVIHHSATNAGSVKGFHRYHTQQGWGGIAYHYVIGNGKGMKDGKYSLLLDGRIKYPEPT